ncbi:hypothetical protein HU200_011547 [Digitaria exilis]|uniref:Uncharacterized protein n=1 Tax=Digitaria exilis TaxID=1010633 RepID=A0A835KL96_9POAL|nr:hypothetical protein HU200_011547 [Digitaria exilis]
MPGSLQVRNTKGNEWIRRSSRAAVPLLSRRLLASLAPTRRLPLRTPSLPFTSLPPPSLPSSLSLSHSRRLPYRTPSLPSTSPSPSPPSLPAKTKRAVLERPIRDAFTVPEHPRESAIQQKPGPEVNQNPVENDVNPEKETDELPGSEANPEPVEKCQETVTIPDKQADPEAGFEVNQKPSETCQETSAESDVNTEKQTYDPGVIYRCKKCRRMLATQEFVVTHEWKKDMLQISSFAWGAKLVWDNSTGLVCSAAVEPG